MQSSATHRKLCANLPIFSSTASYLGPPCRQCRDADCQGRHVKPVDEKARKESRPVGWGWGLRCHRRDLQTHNVWEDGGAITQAVTSSQRRVPESHDEGRLPGAEFPHKRDGRCCADGSCDEEGHGAGSAFIHVPVAPK